MLTEYYVCIEFPPIYGPFGGLCRDWFHYISYGMKWLLHCNIFILSQILIHSPEEVENMIPGNALSQGLVPPPVQNVISVDVLILSIHTGCI